MLSTTEHLEKEQFSGGNFDIIAIKISMTLLREQAMEAHLF